MHANHLFCYHDHRLNGEPPIAMVEEVFKRGSQEVNDEDVVETFLAEVVDVWNASYHQMSVQVS